MSVTIITPANLGKKKNIPTTDIMPVLEVFAREGVLDRVICQLEKDSPFPHTYPSIPKLIWYGVRLIEVMRSEKFPRAFLEKISDFSAQWRFGRPDAVLFHGGYSFPRTLNRVQEKGIIAIDLARTAHFAENIRLEREELKNLGLADTRGVFASLAREDGHHNDFDYVIAMSSFVKETYVREGFPRECIFVAAPDIDIARFAPRERDANEPFRALYVADTQSLKGLHYLLDAWESLALPDAELWIAGWMSVPSELAERYEAQMKRLANVHQFPHVGDIERLYNQASVLVFPSLTEGFGRVTLEAMASGLPVITTENAKGLVEDGKSGFVVPIRDTEAVAEKIKYFYEHRDVALKMGKEARRAVENKKPFGQAIYGIYEEIMRREGKL